MGSGMLLLVVEGIVVMTIIAGLLFSLANLDRIREENMRRFEEAVEELKKNRSNFGESEHAGSEV